MHADMSFWGLFMQASPLVKLVMLMLVAMSVASWTMIISRRKALRETRSSVETFESRFWSGIDLNKLYKESENHRSKLIGVEAIFNGGFKEFLRLHKSSTSDPESIMAGTQRAMRVSISREVERVETSLSTLATIGSISPYIGLFGTVWGIMNAFIALGEVEQATLSMVAPGIAEALIATAMGLFAAIPAVIAYNRFSHQVANLENSFYNFNDEFAGILQRQLLVTRGQ